MIDFKAVAKDATLYSRSVPQTRLEKAAHEFEGQMMKELLKPLIQSSSLIGEDKVGSEGVLGEFAAESLGRALSERGGIGIAHRILGTIVQPGNRNEEDSGNHNLHFDT